MKRPVLLGIVAVLLFLGIGSIVNATPVTFLEMHSEAGDFIGQGENYFFDETDGIFGASQSYFGNSEYLNNSINLNFRSYDRSNWWYLSFSTHELGTDLTQGTYTAARFPFEPEGSAGMSISGNGRGSNRLTGTFTILDIDFGLDRYINSFAATFEQHSEGNFPALTGSIYYNSELSPVPEPTTIILFGTGLAFFVGSRIKRKISIENLRKTPIYY